MPFASLELESNLVVATPCSVPHDSRASLLAPSSWVFALSQWERYLWSLVLVGRAAFVGVHQFRPGKVLHLFARQVEAAQLRL